MNIVDISALNHVRVILKFTRNQRLISYCVGTRFKSFQQYWIKLAHYMWHWLQGYAVPFDKDLAYRVADVLL